MTTVAEIALKADASEVKGATTELEKLAKAGAKAEVSTGAMGRGFGSASAAANSMGAAEKRAAQETNILAEAQKQAAVSARTNEAAMARAGVTMTGASGTSRSMAANMLNLSRQGQDVATMFALGAPPMQIFSSQGFQIVDVLSQMRKEAALTGDSLTAMAGRGLASMGPYALAAAAGLGLLSVALSGLTTEINKNSEVVVTWQDTALGAFDMLSDYVSTTVTDAFKALGLDVGDVWQGIVTGVTGTGDIIISTFVAARQLVVAAWQTFPGAFAELVINAANGAIHYLEGMVNGSIALVNSFSSRVNGIIGSDIGMIGNIDIPAIENRFAGAGRVAGMALSGAVTTSVRHYFRDFAENLSPYAQERARDRLRADAEAAGANAGGRLGHALGGAAADAARADLAGMFDGAFNDLQRDIDARNNLAREKSDRAGAEEKQRILDRYAEEKKIAETQIENLAGIYETLFSQGVGGVWQVFEKQGLAAIAQVAAQWSASMNSPGGNGGIGGLLGGLGAAAGANPVGMFFAITSAANKLGEGISDLTGLAYSSKAGSFFGLGGGLIAGALQSAKYGTANVTGSGALGITSKGKGRADGASDLGGSVQSALQNIASALGVGVGAYNVSIGTYKDSYRVSGSGKTGKLKGGDVQDFGTDSAGAIAFAITDALKDGAIIASQSIKNLLGKGSDIQAQIDKALTFKGVFDALLEATDPAAFALKNITTQFDALRKIFDEAGASAAEYADLEKLLGLKRQEAIDAARQAKVDDLSDIFGLQIRMLELMGKGEEALTAARILEIAGMKASLQPLQAMVYELEDARAVVEKFGPLGDALRAFKQELTGGAGAAPFGSITAKFRNTAANASVGDATALAAFAGDARAYLDAAKANASTSLEYQRALSEVLVGADKGIFAADTQVQMAQLQIDAITANTNVLQQMRTEIKDANLQIAAISTSQYRLFQKWDADGLLVSAAP